MLGQLPGKRITLNLNKLKAYRSHGRRHVRSEIQAKKQMLVGKYGLWMDGDKGV